MAKKSKARYNKTITIRVSEQQFKNYHVYCTANGVALNELARFALDKAAAGKDVDVERLMEIHAQRMS